MAINAALDISLKSPIRCIKRKANINDLAFDINIYREERGLIEIASLWKYSFSWGLPPKPTTICPAVRCKRSSIQPIHHQITTVIIVLL